MKEITEVVSEAVEELINDRTIAIGTAIPLEKKGVYRRYFKLFALSELLRLPPEDILNSCGFSIYEIARAKDCVRSKTKLPNSTAYINRLKHLLKLDEGSVLPNYIYSYINRLGVKSHFKRRLMRHAFCYIFLNAGCYSCYSDEDEIKTYHAVIEKINQVRKS